MAYTDRLSLRRPGSNFVKIPRINSRTNTTAWWSGVYKRNITKKLKIYPVAMIPHKSKPYICILDMLFTLFNKGVKLASVNDKIKNTARSEAMAQLRLVIKRMIQTMEKYRHHSFLIKISKVYVKDGFWRMAVYNEDARIFFMYCHTCRQPQPLMTYK